MKVSTSTITVTKFEVGGLEYVIRFDPELPEETIVVRDEKTFGLLRLAIEEEAEEATLRPARQIDKPIVRETREVKPAAVNPIQVEIPPTKHRKQGGTTKIATLGCTRPQLEQALRQRGGTLSPIHQQILALAVSGRSVDDSAEILGISSYAVTSGRREAATVLGFTPKHYPKLSAAIKSRGTRAEQAARRLKAAQNGAHQ